MITKRCAYCGTLFHADSSDRKYCSPTCYSQSRVKPLGKDKVVLTCPTCGNTFYTTPAIASKRTYCSRACKEAHQGERAAVLLRQIPDQPCVVCGTMFRPAQRGIECCSFACSRLKARKHQREDITHCQMCGAALTNRQISNQTKYCSRQCLGDANRLWHADETNKAFMRQHGARTVAQGQQAPTRIERMMADALDRAGIRYSTQYQIGHYVCDFVVGMLVIECDGTYWHGLPKMIARDARKDIALRNHGYTVLRFSETEIHQDVDQCVRHIREYLP